MLTTVYSLGRASNVLSTIKVEVDIRDGIGIHLIGLADNHVKESLLRTITALQSCGYKCPGKKIVINLIPSVGSVVDGSFLDLPIALGVLIASGQIKPAANRERDFIIAGELGLDGSVRYSAGTSGSTIDTAVKVCGLKGCIVPFRTATEMCFTHPLAYTPGTLQEAIKILEEKDGTNLQHLIAWKTDEWGKLVDELNERRGGYIYE